MNGNRWSTKLFDELTNKELHDLLKLRVDVFVVEQVCAYPEIDGADPTAIHLLAQNEEDELIAYGRILPPDEHGLPHVGRIVVRNDQRNQSLASELMQRAMDILLEQYGTRTSALAAQSHLEKFYARFGYARVGPEYMWDGIMHVDMERGE